ncbi:MAG: aminotransferase class V-fold PLP-dependent enzyme, partial [Chloroflexota bacterium]|nr:aminotransferase class V-fold PLP-dependent enzyme [Chloroflexota bacterium]
SPMCRPGLEALAGYWAVQSTTGVLTEPDYMRLVERARLRMALLIGADPSEIGWVQNTSTAMNLVAHGLDWQAGDNVVTIQGEFPANVYPWLGLKRLDVETRFVEQRNGRVLVDDIAAAIDGRTRLLSVSFVEFATGFRNDLAALGQLCQDRGILFNVDAIQGLGALRLNVHGMGIHFMGAGAHKWLLGPQGVGMFYVRRDVLDLLRPITANWFSVVARDEHLNYGQSWVDAASRIEGSTSNLSGLVAFDAVLGMLHEVGIPYIEGRVLSLNSRLLDGLETRGYEIASSRLPGECSGVVCFRAKGDPKDILARALAEKIAVAVRVGVVRVSPHFYNTEDEIDSFLALL